jgi:hypothetical protein
LGCPVKRLGVTLPNFAFAVILLSSVSDPDPQKIWLGIRMKNADLDPDPAAVKSVLRAKIQGSFQANHHKNRH